MPSAIPPLEMRRKRTGSPVRWWVRSGLLVVVGGLVAVFVTAVRLHPYDENGQPLRHATHLQLGLGECKFYEYFGKPCPACGMTTSFSLLMHGDVGASLRANFVGTLLALFCLAAIPWCLDAVVRGRYRWVRKLEPVMLVVVGITTVLMLLRWGIVLLLRHD